jgi:hypothetical protein
LSRLRINFVSSCLRQQFKLVDSSKPTRLEAPVNNLSAQLKVNFISEVYEDCIGSVSIVSLYFPPQVFVEEFNKVNLRLNRYPSRQLNLLRIP